MLQLANQLGVGSQGLLEDRPGDAAEVHLLEVAAYLVLDQADVGAQAAYCFDVGTLLDLGNSVVGVLEQRNRRIFGLSFEPLLDGSFKTLATIVQRRDASGLLLHKLFVATGVHFQCGSLVGEQQRTECLLGMHGKWGDTDTQHYLALAF